LTVENGLDVGRQQTVVLEKAVAVFANFAAWVVVVDVTVGNEHLLLDASVTYQFVSCLALSTYSLLSALDSASFWLVVTSAVALELETFSAGIADEVRIGAV
jgi:hypothetical protein